MKLFAGFGRRHVVFAFCFSVVVQLAHLSYAWLGKEELQAGIVATWTLMYFLLALVGLACAVAADNALGESAGTAKRLVVAMLATAIVATATVEAVLYLLPQSVALAVEGKERLAFLSTLHRIAYRFSTASGWSLLLIALYTMLQASRRAASELHAVRLAAVAAERNLVEADLRAMQARVEPDLLFAALVAVDQAYARSVEAGEQALDALIAFLRAALPAEAGASSTLAAELELVRAYVGVRELLSVPRPKLEIAADPAARAQALPAMLLLPLVRRALDGAPGASLSVGARVGDAKLEVTLRSDSSDAAPTEDLSGLQARLAQLFAGRARLEAIGGGARLEIPLAV